MIVEAQPPNAELRARVAKVIQPARAAQAAVLATYDDTQLATLFDYFSRSTEAPRTVT